MPFQLHQVTFRNLYSWKTLAIRPGTPLVALIGANDTGKSNILRALDLLGRLSLQGTSALSGSLAALAYFGDTRTGISLELEGSVDGSAVRYSFSATQAALNSAIVSEDSLDIESCGKWTRLTDEKQNLPSGMRYPEGHTILSYSQGTAPALQHPQLQSVRQGLAALAVYRPRPELIARPHAPVADLQLLPDGSNLVAVIERLAADPEHQERFRMITARLSELIPAIRRVGAVPQGDGTLRALRFQAVFGEHSLNFGAAEASEGTLLALAYLVMAEGPSPSPWLLLEEPENGLHPRRLAEIVEILRRIGRKVILTTHSPYLLDALDPSEVQVVTRDSNGASQIHPMTAFPTLSEWQKGFSTGEIWSNLGEQELVSGQP